MRTMRPRTLLLSVLLLALPTVAGAGVCDFYCLSPLDIATVESHGIQHGSATIEIKNAVSSSLLPDLNYIEDGDNGQDFRVDDPFFGIPTIVRRDGMLKIKTNNHRIPVVFNLYDSSGSYIPFPVVIPANKTISWPAAALPCWVWYSISSPLTSAQVGQIVVVEASDGPLGLMLGAVDGVIGDLCPAGGAKADLAILNMTDGDNGALATVQPGDEIRWFNSFDAATTLSFSDGNSLPIAAHSWSTPLSFATEGVISYTASGHAGQGVVQVTGDPTATEDMSWGALKGRFAN